MRRSEQSGFTLIEFAIVMLIISLMITLTAKGNELLNNTTVKMLAFDFHNIQLAINSYQDEFHALPGDDRKASAHLPDSGVSINNGNGDSIIGGSWNSTAGESFDLWQHVRLAGLMQGSTDEGSHNYIPHNASGGALGVSSSSASPIPGLKGEYVICSDHIPGRLVKQLDLAMDDGDTAFGSMRVSASTTGGAAVHTNDIIDGGSYLVCLGD